MEWWIIGGLAVLVVILLVVLVSRSRGGEGAQASVPSRPSRPAIEETPEERREREEAEAKRKEEERRRQEEERREEERREREEADAKRKEEERRRQEEERREQEKARRLAEADRIENNRLAEIKKQEDLWEEFVDDICRNITEDSQQSLFSRSQSHFFPSARKNSAVYSEITDRFGKIDEPIIYCCRCDYWFEDNEYFLILQSGIAGSFNKESVWYIPFEELEELAWDNNANIRFNSSAGYSRSCRWKCFARKPDEADYLKARIMEYIQVRRTVYEINETAFLEAIDAKSFNNVKIYLDLLENNPRYLYYRAIVSYTYATDEFLSEELSRKDITNKLRSALNDIRDFEIRINDELRNENMSNEVYRVWHGGSEVFRARILIALGEDKLEIRRILNAVSHKDYPQKTRDDAARIINDLDL